MKKVLFSSLLLIFTLIKCQKVPSKNKEFQAYPDIKGTTVIDNYFGKKVEDQYRVLEDLNNPEVKQWFGQQKIFFNNIIENITNRDTLFKEIEQSLYSSNISAEVPRAAGKRIFFERKYLKEKIQKIFYTEELDKKEVEAFSTDQLSKENASYRIDYFEPSYDGKFLAFGISFLGNELSVLHILDVEKKTLLPERIQRARYGNPQWLPDGSGFFYKQLKELNSDEDKKTRYEDSRIRLHKLNTDEKEDREIFSRSVLGNQLPIEKLHLPYLYTFPKSDTVIAGTLFGTESYYDLYYASLTDILTKPSKDVSWKPICTSEEKVGSFSLVGKYIFLLTYQTSSYGKIERRLLGSPKGEVVLDESDMVLKEIIQNNHSLFVKSFRNGASKLTRIDPVKLSHSEIQLPLDGSLEFQPGYKLYLNSEDLFLLLGSWTKAWKIYQYNPKSNKFNLTKIRPDDPLEKKSDLILKEVEVVSHDGVLVPLSILYNKNTKLNAQNPAILYGYGAYGLSMSPQFDPARLAWLNRGGIYAVAHVRGGGEKGDLWYKGGYKATKPNSWKDLIACAEYLIKNKYTSPSHLAAEGASAGGITIGRAFTERPDLFKAAVISYGRVNTLRHENTFNSANISEYGTVKDSTEFNYLYNMDVYHHIKEGVNYPSVLFSTGMNDSRVEPWQPAKVVAKMQKVSDGSNLVLFRVTEEGHFGELYLAKELTDRYTFLLWQLGHKDFKYIKKKE